MTDTSKTPSKLTPRKQLISYISKEAAMDSDRAARKTLDVVIAGIAKILQEGKTLLFLDLGSFSIQERASMQGRNPRTGDPIQVPACKKLRFRTSTVMKKALNPGNYLTEKTKTTKKKVASKKTNQ